MRIMVLDSTDSDRIQAVKYIKKLMHYAEITDFSDGREALSAALKKPPDILITEVLCNGMDGLFMAKALRDKKIKVNIIFITDHKNSEKYALDFFQMQASYCVDKPLDMLLIGDAIEKIRFPIKEWDKNNILKK